MFVDKVIINVRGGDGGNGCASFRREKFIPKGGPSGGDGGIGGSVVLIADTGQQSLVDFYYKRHYRGKNGENGRSRDQYGKNGKDVELHVPVGTIIKDIDDNFNVLFDLDKPGARFTIAKGGDGGRGNIHFASSTNRIPREWEPGTPGETKNLELELKSIADIGLVGYPNAGKSTLLGAFTAARPKVAPYPFTTLRPNVGTVEFPDYYRISIADIPGLIDGAHENVGLGHDFLRHIERTKILVYVLDMAAFDGRDPYDDFISLKKELDLYLEGLSSRSAIIAANKMDLPEAEKYLSEFKKKVYDIQIIPISASNSDNLDEVLKVLRIKVEKNRAKA